MITVLLPESCYSIYMKGFCGSGYSQWSAPLNNCMPNCADSGACSQVLLLNAFLDSNNNGLKDTGEVVFNNGNFVYQVNDSPDNQYGFTNNVSYNILDSNPSNSYHISFAINGASAGYYASSAAYSNITLPSGSGDHYLYFQVVVTTPFTDVAVYLSPSGRSRLGFTYSNTIVYQNNGNQTIPNGTITYNIDSNVSINSIFQTGTTSTSTEFTYDFTNLAPFETRYITVYLAVPTTVNLGDLVNNNATVQIADDANVSNNSSFLTQVVTGSYDFNDKMESYGGKIVHSAFTANDYLYYAIKFENTGSASADFIRVEDALDSQLDKTHLKCFLQVIT
ncbi:hypothetical protein [Flavobacterium sp.]|uniref:DUF7619 domain-containing protein n=1 Tax=Flavobacterium sp. TaxID=239 RepID=UPI0025F74AF7|nr:hypothetical protein [Flavobacterium sp.]